MKRARLTVHLLLGGMILLPCSFFLEAALTPTSDALPTVFRPELALHPQAPMPSFDALKKIDRVIIATYVTKKGDTLWQLAKKLNFSREDNDTVRSSNGLDFGYFSEGTVLRLPNHKGTLYEVAGPENLRAICQGYAMGRKHGHAFEEQVLAANGFPLPNLTDPEHRFEKGTVLFLPEVFKPFGFPIPLPGKIRISSGFGRRRHPVLGITRQHKGIDIPKPYGTPVHSSLKGVVTFAGWMGGYGNMVEIRHAKKRGNQWATYYTRYGHLSYIAVHEGQSVNYSTLIGKVGSTGISTGPHLHFEVRDSSGRAIPPQ
jgi:murein DD-endopeptidase MepM/ murein hydrolase activator NlpD